MLLLSEIAKSGFIKNGEISTAAKELPRFLAIERQALQTLGLERRAKTVMQLNEYIDAQRSKQDGQSGSECP
jgi:hypothetical protein